MSDVRSVCSDTLSDRLEGTSRMPSTAIDFGDIDLTDSRHFVNGVPHQWFAFLRQHAPVWWHEEDRLWPARPAESFGGAWRRWRPDPPGKKR